MSRVERALLSVSDKTGLVEFAQGLVEMGVEIVSTGGTAKTLDDAGVPRLSVSDVTRFPEMLDGRVKTLHPAIHGGILADRSKPEHLQTLTAHSISLIGLVVVNLYPFQKTIQKPGVTRKEAIENIDIGGPAMIRSAAKNHASVGVVVSPGSYAVVLNEMRANGGELSQSTRDALAILAFRLTSEYDKAIADYLSI